jgi:hypothetical protein
VTDAAGHDVLLATDGQQIVRLAADDSWDPIGPTTFASGVYVG